MHPLGHNAAYHLVNWDTPISVSSCGSLLTLENLMVSPRSQQLTIEIKNIPLGRSPEQVPTISFAFPCCIAFGLIDEWYFNAGGKAVSAEPLGNTLMVLESPWIAKLKENSPVFDVCGPENAKHYVFFTSDHVIEVVSDWEPIVRSLA